MYIYILYTKFVFINFILFFKFIHDKIYCYMLEEIYILYLFYF